MESKKIKVIVVRPHEEARVEEIGTTLVEMQKVVEGYIEIFHPWDGVCIICNEEGKINGMDPCRVIYGDDGKLIDIIYGPFFLCNTFETFDSDELEEGEEFGSLTPEQIEKYLGILNGYGFRSTTA